MYHSITFGTIRNGKVVGYNTWDDWYLLPSERPSVAQAGVNTAFVDVPGSKEGAMDMTEYMTGNVVYTNRSGSFEFYVENDHEDWVTLHDRICSALHGKRLAMSLEDEPEYYYFGRFTFNEWKSESWNSKVVIDYAVEPYKYQSWLWDPFNFLTDITEGRV